MKSPSISIAIPVFNEEKNLDKCLRSIFSQNYSGKIEVIIADAGSSDKTLEIARRYPVTVINISLDNPAENMVVGKMSALRIAKGKYFTYLDADIDLPVKNWIEKMVRPLEKDKGIIGSVTKFVSYKKDPALNKYLTLDPIQRDPLFVFLTYGFESVVEKKLKGYYLCEYSEEKIPPMGPNVFRTEKLLSVYNKSNKKFYELDNLVILVKKGYRKFAYVPNTGLHHLTVPDLSTMLKKRFRNLKTTFFVSTKKEKRLWTWIDIKNPRSILKLLLWILYAETLVGPTVLGIYKTFKYKTWVGLYEPLVTFLTTNLILYAFIFSASGRDFILGIGKSTLRLKR